MIRSLIFMSNVFRQWCVVGTIVGGLGALQELPVFAQLTSGLISQQQATSVGLKRAWFARAEVNPARSKVVDWILSNDVLLLVTDAGVIHAMDANNGKTLWVTQFGNPNYPSLGPAANNELVAVVNGSTLYLIDRHNGRIQSERRVGGAPGAGPALSNSFVFVPMVNGMIEGYPLASDAPVGSRWFYKSFGRAMVPPLVTSKSLAWTTDLGYLYVGGSDEPGIRFRMETKGQFDARPAYRDPLIYAASLSGEVFAIDENLGMLRWKYAMGYPTDRAPAAVDHRLFVTSEEPLLHCVDADTGLGQWEAGGIVQFAAVTKAHVYGVDRYGTIHILGIQDGAPVGRIPSGGTLEALVNDQTDRLYLISDAGLVQCLHEIGADKPTHYDGRPSATETLPTPLPAGDGEEMEEYRPTQATAPPAEPSTAEAPFAVPDAQPPAEDPFSDDVAPPADVDGFGTDDEDPFN